MQVYQSSRYTYSTLLLDTYSTCLLYGQVRELELADKHGGGFDEREPRRSEEAGVGRVEHDVEADAERQDKGGVPTEEEGERSEDLGN